MKERLRAAARFAPALGLAVGLACASAAHAEAPEVFAAKCAVCHMANAQGTPGFVPPLTETLGYYAESAEGRALLARIVTYGMVGPITVGGRSYAGSMAVVQPLTDQEAADALNHVLSRHNQRSLPAGFQPFSPDEIRQLRAEKATPVKVHAARQALVERLRSEGKPR